MPRLPPSRVTARLGLRLALTKTHFIASLKVFPKEDLDGLRAA